LAASNWDAGYGKPRFVSLKVLELALISALPSPARTDSTKPNKGERAEPALLSKRAAALGQVVEGHA
jgi:hypothetical protein